MKNHITNGTDINASFRVTNEKKNWQEHLCTQYWKYEVSNNTVCPSILWETPWLWQLQLEVLTVCRDAVWEVNPRSITKFLDTVRFRKGVISEPWPTQIGKIDIQPWWRELFSTTIIISRKKQEEKTAGKTPRPVGLKLFHRTPERPP